MRRLTRQHGIPLIVDDRLDVALAVEADGLHVGKDDLPWRTARRLLGKHRSRCTFFHRLRWLRWLRWLQLIKKSNRQTAKQPMICRHM